MDVLGAVQPRALRRRRPVPGEVPGQAGGRPGAAAGGARQHRPAAPGGRPHRHPVPSRRPGEPRRRGLRGLHPRMRRRWFRPQALPQGASLDRAGGAGAEHRLRPLAFGRATPQSEGMRRLLATALAAALAAAPNLALAWGSSGHRMIGELAVRALPAEVPAFLRTPAAALDVGELSREPDRSKGAGRLHDNDRDPGHFLDLDDSGKVLGGPLLSALPPTRADYEAALRAAGTDTWKAGYLPYSIVDRWQQLALDFAYWRVLTAAEKNPQWAAHR